ncbi:MAG: response regulator transcription factor [Tissierellales bacterium]|jgi:DNA-binding response OmpR family regulator|nr:response regulator transcription factor [Tissierellales bacterium]
MTYNILIVEDQIDISNIIEKYLEKYGYDYDVASDGFKALDYFGKKTYHIVLLDIMMPGIDGFEVLKNIRETSDIPVLMVSAKKEEIDRLQGFDLGADDYIVKPFSVKELIKRIEVMLKRVYGDLAVSRYSFKNLSLDSNAQILYKDGVNLSLTSLEYKIMKVFFDHKNQVLSRQQLINLVFGYDYDGYDRSVDSSIKRLRHKIEENPKEPKFIITKYGAGYKFGGDDSDD